MLHPPSPLTWSARTQTPQRWAPLRWCVSVRVRSWPISSRNLRASELLLATSLMVCRKWWVFLSWDRHVMLLVLWTAPVRKWTIWKVHWGIFHCFCLLKLGNWVKTVVYSHTCGRNSGAVNQCFMHFCRCVEIYDYLMVMCCKNHMSAYTWVYRTLVKT